MKKALVFAVSILFLFLLVQPVSAKKVFFKGTNVEIGGGFFGVRLDPTLSERLKIGASFRGKLDPFMEICLMYGRFISGVWTTGSRQICFETRKPIINGKPMQKFSEVQPYLDRLQDYLDEKTGIITLPNGITIETWETTKTFTHRDFGGKCVFKVRVLAIDRAWKNEARINYTYEREFTVGSAAAGTAAAAGNSLQRGVTGGVVEESVDSDTTASSENKATGAGYLAVGAKQFYQVPSLLEYLKANYKSYPLTGKTMIAVTERPEDSVKGPGVGTYYGGKDLDKLGIGFFRNDALQIAGIKFENLKYGYVYDVTIYKFADDQGYVFEDRSGKSWHKDGLKPY